MKNSSEETVDEFVSRVMRESKFDIDIDFCTKNNIKFPEREENLIGEADAFARLANPKITAKIFDYLTKNDLKL